MPLDVNILNKKVKALIPVSTMGYYSPSNDPYYLQFKGTNSKRRRIGIITNRTPLKSLSKCVCRSDYTYTIQYENGDTIHNLPYRQIEVQNED